MDELRLDLEVVAELRELWTKPPRGGPIDCTLCFRVEGISGAAHSLLSRMVRKRFLLALADLPDDDPTYDSLIAAKKRNEQRFRKILDKLPESAFQPLPEPVNDKPMLNNPNGYTNFEEANAEHWRQTKEKYAEFRREIEQYKAKYLAGVDLAGPAEPNAGEAVPEPQAETWRDRQPLL